MKKKQEIDEQEEELEEQPWHVGPIKIMIGLFLALIIIMMAVPYYGVKLDPEPKKMITLSDLNVEQLQTSNLTYSFDELYKIVKPDDVQTKHIANLIASYGCDDSRVCQAKAIYYFVRDNINYVRDPFNTEYIEDPKEVLKSKGGDCESGSILLATLEKAIGVQSQLVIISEHAYLRIKLPEAINKYKIEEDWVYLDWTCNECGFGEVPWQDIQKRASYINV
jgi:hypothetical protein